MARDIQAAGHSHHDTLGAGVVDRVTLDGDFANVRVWNRDGAGELTFTVDTAGDPVALADGTYVLPAAISTVVKASSAAGTTVVKLVSPVAIKYSVVGEVG